MSVTPGAQVAEFADFREHPVGSRRGVKLIALVWVMSGSIRALRGRSQEPLLAELLPFFGG